jgi:fibronectin type 3 domain-containing protein
MRILPRVSRRLSIARGVVLRNWVALYLQERREKRAATHVAVPGVPNAPQSLSVSNIGTALELTWVDMSSDETAFRLYRKVDAGSFGLFQTLAANTTDYVDGAVLSGHLYTYYVTAVNGVGESAASNVVSMTFEPS